MPPKSSPKGSGNRSITAFFKPVVASQEENRPASQASQAKPRSTISPATRPASSPSITVASPGLSNQNVDPPHKRDVIAASDDEDDDDDDSSDGGFMDLLSAFDTKKSSTTANANRSFETPRAKRSMNVFHSSPLTINTKSQHMFDMKALARDAKIDDATKASSAELRDLVAEAEAEEEKRDIVAELDGTIKDIVQDQGDHNAQRVMRAVQRTEDHGAPHFHFFKIGFQHPEPRPVPIKSKRGLWKLLLHNNIDVREQYFASGMPYTMLRKGVDLPDEVFEWVLDDLCIQKSRLLGQEYGKLISCCSAQIHSLLTPGRVAESLVRLGAMGDASPSENQQTVTRGEEDSYDGRDWSSLRFFLKLLDDAARDLSLDSLCFTIKSLLRISMDKFLSCNMDLLVDFQATMRSLLESLPGNRWDSFCLEACAAMHNDFKAQLIRLNSLQVLPVDCQRAHDLRRRLAVVFLFEDPNLGDQNPAHYMTIRRLIDRLKQDDFNINSKTDFDQFRASVLILDVVIDDGSFMPTGSADDEAAFNSEVDELALALRGFWTKINDSGLKLTRAQTKSVVEWVQQRVAVSVRTRRKFKKDIYDTALENDPFLPRQQTFMKDFLGKKIRN